MSLIKLFCIPYAGGSAEIYAKWKNHIGSNIILCPIELAGRGQRFNESLYSSLNDAVDDVFNIIKSEITTPYAIFGHSMGALITFKLMEKIRLMKMEEPTHLFFSGRGAPHICNRDEKKYHLMNNETFKEEVIKLGGTSSEFFKHKELVELILPMLKNDFRLAEIEEIDPIINPFDFNISILVGKDENLSSEQVTSWNEYTSKLCSVHYFNGGHFFLHEETEHVIQLINNNLSGEF